MKKTTIVLAALSFSLSAFAQKSKIYTAKEYMRDGKMNEAVTAINEAVNHEKTMSDGDAWFTRGEIYEKLAETDPSNFGESVKSYIKVLEVKPNYDKETINLKLLRSAYKSYNNGVMEYQAQPGKYDDAYKNFQLVVDIHDINSGKQFGDNKKFDTIAAQALKFQALSAFYAKKDDLAITALKKAKDNAIARDPYIYSTIIDIYTKENNNSAIESTLEEAKKYFPKNAEISRQEMNYYNRTNQTDVLITKMEDAVKTDPSNALLQFNLGVLYSGLANPVDETGKPKAKPANAKELFGKAEMAYKYAIDADPTKAEYAYNLGALYFNKAADITTQMQSLGTSEAENKKYDELNKIRLAEFTKGLTPFQQAYNLLSPKADKLNNEDLATYNSTLIALETIYEALGQKEKSSDVAKKREALNK